MPLTTPFIELLHIFPTWPNSSVFPALEAQLPCICYALVALGALATFATNKPIDLAAALVGLATCMLGVVSQFVEGAAPTGDAQWGIWLGLIGISASMLWVASRIGRAWRRPGITRYGTHTDADRVQWRLRAAKPECSRMAKPSKEFSATRQSPSTWTTC
jgi:hypothetical protein